MVQNISSDDIQTTLSHDPQHQAYIKKQGFENTNHFKRWYSNNKKMILNGYYVAVAYKV